MTTPYKDYEDMLETALSAGLRVIGSDGCARLLAWAYIIGGYTEESTHNKKLYSDIRYASQIANIGGGLIPDPEISESVREYSGQLQNFVNGKSEKPEWLTEFEKYYKIRSYKIQK